MEIRSKMRKKNDIFHKSHSDLYDFKYVHIQPKKKEEKNK